MHFSKASATAMRSLLLAVLLGAPSPAAMAQASPEPAPVHKSVRGTLDRVDSRLSSVIMKSDTGETMTWRFSPAVIGEAAKFKAGTPVIVIYRQTSPSEK